MDTETTESRLIAVTPARLSQEVVRIADYDINYVTAGQGEPLLLIHGGNIGWGQWYPNISDLARHFSVFAIDLPGAGRSTRLDYSQLDFKSDFVDVVDEFIALQNFQRLNIVGSSIGGWIALKLAIRHGGDGILSKLELVDCIGFTSHLRLADRLLGFYSLATLLSKTLLRPHRANKNIEKFLRDVFYDKSFPISDAFIDYFYETMETSHLLLLISKMSSPWGMREEFVLESDLPKVKAEVMVIWGREDRLLPPDQNIENVRLIPNVRIKILQDAGHIPSIEKSEQFNKLTLEFLKSCATNT